MSIILWMSKFWDTFSLRMKDSIVNALNLVNVSDARVTFREEYSDGGEEALSTGEFRGAIH